MWTQWGGASSTVSEKCGVCLSSLVSLLSLTLLVHAGVLSLCLSLCTPCSTEHVVRRNKGGFEVLAGCPRCLPKECCKDQVWIRDRRAKTIGGPSFDPFTLPRRPHRWLETRFLNAVAGVQTPSVQPFIWTPNLPATHCMAGALRCTPKSGP